MARAEPDRAALEVAHRMLASNVPLDDMLKDPALNVALKAVARRHMRRRAQVDLKKLQANDND
jgi:heme oxygenase